LIHYSLITLIAFLAYLLKGLTGFGPAIVFISLGSLVMDPVRVVTISPLLDVVAGCVLMWKTRYHFSERYWLILALPLIGGVILGSTGLRFTPTDHYHQVLGAGITVLGFWFLLKQKHSEDTSLTNENKPMDRLPGFPGKGAFLAAGFSGLTGGLFGISGPALIWYFGKHFEHRVFRKIIVPLFFIEAACRSSVYAVLGMYHKPDLALTGALIPALFLGLFVGNHWFNIIPQKHFERVVGFVLIVSGIKLFLG